MGPLVDVFHSLLALAVVGLSAFGLGRPLVRWLAIADDDPLATAVWSAALGLLAAGWVLLLLAGVGWLGEPLLGVLSLAGSLWAVGEFMRVYLTRATGRPLAIDHVPSTPHAVAPAGGSKAAISLAALAMCASLIAALAPPASPSILAGPLDLAKSVLLNHGTVGPQGQPLPANLSQMWSLWALALDGPVAASLVHWALGVLLALAAVLLARPLVGHAPAWMAGCLVLLCPGVQHQMSGPLDDLAPAVFATLALAAMVQVLVEWAAGGWTSAAGLMLGATIATSPASPPALVFALCASGVWISTWRSQFRSRSDLTRAASALALAALVAAGPALLAGPAAFRWNAPQSVTPSVAQIGPLFVMAAGALALARRLRGLGLIWSVLGPFAAASALVPWQGGWWSLAVGPLSVAAVWIWQEIGRLPKAPRLVAAAAMTVVAVAGVATTCQIAAGSLAVAAGWQARHDYLLARVATYRAASLVNRIVGPGERLFCQDPRTLYFACPTASPRDFQSHPAGSPANGSDGELIAWAQAEGFSYLLLAESVEPASDAPASSSPRFAAGPPPEASASRTAPIGELLPILEYRFADDNNRSIRYSLLKVQPLASARRTRP